jgi:hypothetical protein
LRRAALPADLARATSSCSRISAITLVGVPIGQHIDAYITGDDGKRTLVKVVTKETSATKR